MANKKRITKPEFLAIKREVKAALEAGTYNADSIAAKMDVGPSAVRMVRRVRSYPKYQELNARNVAIRKAREAGLPLVGVPPRTDLPTHKVLSTAEYEGILRRLGELEAWKERCFQSDVEELGKKMTLRPADALGAEMPEGQVISEPPRKRSFLWRR